MDSLPVEMIELIGHFLDFHSAARFSFTCRTAYELVHPYISKMVAVRKSICREIAAVKYEICERDESVRGDIYGNYCSIRSYNCGRVVGALHCTVYNQKNAIAIEDTIFFSDIVEITDGNRGRSVDYLDDDDRQVDIICYCEDLGARMSRCDVIGTGYTDIYWTDARDWRMRSYVSVRVKSPMITAGKLQWKERVMTKNLLELV
jgi:hypothetical protein